MTLTLRTLDNGLTVIADEIPHLESVAYDLWIPGGYINEDEARLGEGTLLSELLGRGAGPYDAEGLVDAFEREGIRHSERCDSDYFALHGECLRESLDEALRLLCLQVTEPSFEEDQLEAVRGILIQELRSLPDSPARLLSIEAAKRYYSPPHNRTGYGSEAGLKASTRDGVVKLHKNCFAPSGAVLSIAGKKVGDTETQEVVAKHFGKLGASKPVKRHPVGDVSLGVHHVKSDSAQTYLSFYFPSVPYGHPEYYTVKVLNEVLSGGTFGRLFLEVREKRGLCYSVFSQHTATSELGTFMVKAGTTPERAAETAAVIQSELGKLSSTLKAEELSRAKRNLDVAIVMSEEGSGARSGSNAADWWRGKRVRPLEEIRKAVDSVTIGRVKSYLETDPFSRKFLISLGSKEVFSS